MSQRVIEELADGSTMHVRAQVIYQGPDGQFISRKEYVARRVESGYGEGGYGN